MLIFSVKNLSKKFGKNIVLEDISFSLSEGERLVIIGPNGSGKSTLINLITGMNFPTTGEIQYLKYKNISEMQKNFGVQFQQISFPGGYKTSELINMVFDLHFKNMDNLSSKEFENKKEEWKKQLIDIFNLESCLKKRASKISGGQKQLLNIMLAFSSKPKLVILDEITTGLDVRAQEEILRFIDEYVKKNNSTLIIVSHILKEIVRLGERFILIDNGKVIADKKFLEIGRSEKSMDSFLNNYFIDGVIKK